MKLVLASSNPGKLAELRDLLGDAGVDLHAQTEFGVEDAEETGFTFVERRTARFVSVLALLRHADDPQPLIAEGVWEGRVLFAPRGSGGFGYDPVFFAHEQGMGAAELDAALKSRISHRGLALATMREKLLAALRHAFVQHA